MRVDRRDQPRPAPRPFGRGASAKTSTTASTSFPIRVPPLRERTEDIPPLVWAILGELNARMGKKITQVSRRTMEALQRHAWPGNVRELRNVLEHAAIVTSGDTVRVPVLDEAMRRRRRRRRWPTSNATTFSGCSSGRDGASRGPTARPKSSA